ncbi:unnamed protein product [Knipowitschia caucasica]|uniref:THAP domain-containing protein 1 n=1 Tax=Knipowitschia caucasica TaxID=637954 RepID=A0AAV2KH70_KNICA
MGRYTCCADNCSSTSDSGIKFFKFPLYNKQKLRRWLQSMGRQTWRPTVSSALCIRHFEEQHLEITGKGIRLREGAEPTLFPCAEVSDEDLVNRTKSQPRGWSLKRRIKEEEASTTERSREEEASTTERSREEASTTERSREEASTTERSREEESGEEVEREEEDERMGEGRWSVVVDEELNTIHSFPHFFHGNYCISTDVRWAPDKDPLEKTEKSSAVIQVTGPWQWLALDLRGPLPQTPSGHRFILSLCDLFSHWLEAWPVDSLQPAHMVRHLVEVIAHFGFPRRILSRLPHALLQQINQQLKQELSVEFPLLIQHPQTGAVEQSTQHMIDRMVQELCEQEPCHWDLYLPAAVFSLCCKENPTTRERPLTALCCAQTEIRSVPTEAQMMVDAGLGDCDVVLS